MAVYIFTALTFLTILIGGLFSIKFKKNINLILGFSAGLLFGLFALEIIPEIFNLSLASNIDIFYPMLALVSGFLVFHILEKTFLVHDNHEGSYQKHQHPSVGLVSAILLIIHSFLDGVGMGVGFKISTGLGVAVAIAVIGHAFSDGLNTGSLMLLNKNSARKTFAMVAINALAPVLGVLSVRFFNLSSGFLLIYLGFFAGIILYISLEDILPEAHSGDSSWKTLALTVLGVLFILGLSIIS
ncbi:MAG: ZIP family metal transporter [bacterium]